MTYDEFRRDYSKKHPNSVPVKQDFHGNGLGARLLWLAVFISAALISSVHTVPTILATIPTGGIIPLLVVNIAALSGFVAVELTIFASAMYKSRGRIATMALVLSLATAVVANIYSAVSTMTGGQSNWFEVLVAVFIGFAAPFTAYVAGEMFARMSEEDKAEQQKIDRAYREDMQRFDKAVLMAYTKATKNPRH